MPNKKTRSTIVTQNTLTGAECQCGNFWPFGAYGIAQMAQGNSVKVKCTCGNQISAKKAGASYAITETGTQ